MIKPVNGKYHFVCDKCEAVCEHAQEDLLFYWWFPREGEITDDVFIIGGSVWCADCYYPYFQPVDYNNYIKSDKWHWIREEKFKKAGYKCEICGAVKNLDVHHVTYKRLGREKMSDLAVLCRKCHKTLHREGAKQWTDIHLKTN